MSFAKMRKYANFEAAQDARRAKARAARQRHRASGRELESIKGTPAHTRKLERQRRYYSRDASEEDASMSDDARIRWYREQARYFGEERAARFADQPDDISDDDFAYYYARLAAHFGRLALGEQRTPEAERLSRN